MFVLKLRHARALSARLEQEESVEQAPTKRPRALSYVNTNKPPLPSTSTSTSSLSTKPSSIRTISPPSDTTSNSNNNSRPITRAKSASPSIRINPTSVSSSSSTSSLSCVSQTPSLPVPSLALPVATTSTPSTRVVVDEDLMSPTTLALERARALTISMTVSPPPPSPSSLSPSSEPASVTAAPSTTSPQVLQSATSISPSLSPSLSPSSSLAYLNDPTRLTPLALECLQMAKLRECERCAQRYTPFAPKCGHQCKLCSRCLGNDLAVLIKAGTLKYHCQHCHKQIETHELKALVEIHVRQPEILNEFREILRRRQLLRYFGESRLRRCASDSAVLGRKPVPPPEGEREKPERPKWNR